MIIIFDLDDTLYERKKFVYNGLQNVAKFVCFKNKKYKTLEIFKELKKLYYNNKIQNIFNQFLKKKKIKNVNVRKCISLYRFGKNNIKVYQDALILLKFFKKTCYLITDGNKIVQRKKIENLNIKNYFKKILITNQYGAKYQKPSLYCFKIIKKIEKCKFNDMVYIGDNPNKDFINCNRVGIHTIRLKRGEFKSLNKKYPYDAKNYIYNFKGLKKLLKSIL